MLLGCTTARSSASNNTLLAHSKPSQAHQTSHTPVEQRCSPVSFDSAAVEAVATCLLAIITLFLAYVARQQYVTSRMQLRAYVFVEDATINPPIGSDDWKIEYKFKNNGVTPARNVRTLDVAAVTDWEPAHLPEPIVADYYGTLAPNGDFIETEADPFQATVEENARITSDIASKAIFLVGRIEYIDVFRQPHFTDFCFYWQGRIGPGTNQMSAYDRGNDAD